MRRWNGWGDETISMPLPDATTWLLTTLIGPGTPPSDIALAQVVASVPDSRLPAHPLASQDPFQRLSHARGQSLPDWVALRSGRIGVFPDSVAFPTTAAEARELVRFAAAVGARVIPYGGGTSVAGHINPPASDVPVLTVDMSRMNRLELFDETSRLATFGAGVRGPDLEAQLRARGYMLGHFPQSFEYSTLGGWIATRSSGQQSLGFGRIEDLFAGGRLESPSGTLELPCFPASAAGPDIRHMVLGSEGRLGLITEATIRVTPLPAREAVHTVFFADWESGLAAAREIVQAALPLTMLRLSTPAETAITLALAGHERVIGAMERYLAARGVGDTKAMLQIGIAGYDTLIKAARQAALHIARQHGGVHLGRAMGRQWLKHRFRAPYLRNALWERGYAVDTVETATTWSRVPTLVAALASALQQGLALYDERVHVFSHLSHLYASGSSIYTTYLYRIAPNPDDTLERWRILKAIASQSIVEHGGTISHQHGVGVDHAPYLEAEKGALGVAAIRALCAQFDPTGMMNPEKLVV